MNNSAAHTKLVDDILLAIGSLPNVRVWPRNVGTFRHLFGNGKIKIGIKGETDIQGIIMTGGRYLCVEVKTGTGRLEPDQKKYREIMEKFGAVYIEARSVEQALTELKRFL